MTPQLSVILPTDTVETSAAVLARLRAQTIAKKIEVILIVPNGTGASVQIDDKFFAAVRVVEIASLSPLGAARALGVRSARAPWIFIGETHSYFHRDTAEKFLAAAEGGPWCTIVPGFLNGNPTSVFSWASFLGDYGRWSAWLPAGEIEDTPLYNALHRREVLLALDERLGQMLSHGDELSLALESRGERAYFEPAACVDHINIDAFFASMRERFLAGRLIGSQRVERWSWSRRLAYIFGAPLIPFVLTWRVWPGVRQTAQAQKVPIGTLPVILLLNFAKVAGEVMSYAFGRSSEHSAAMDHCEIHKLEYLTSIRIRRS
ncbi:MAG: hypothetical protein M3R10_06420 [Verrucomicrobiota bacterium]|nr:hypothetical protein [Verrucomicrobiota bacterium]